MTDVEVVIKLPKSVYDYIKQLGSIPTIDTQCVANAIFDGTSLPKGHGRLIDADVLMKYCQNDISKTIDCNDIARFPAIIQAAEET